LQLSGAYVVCEVYANAHDDAPVALDVPLNDVLEREGSGDGELDAESAQVDEADELDEFQALDDVQVAVVDEQRVFLILDAEVVVCPAEEDGALQESMELDFDGQLDRRKAVPVRKAFLVRMERH
jgi:hypothetical protein